MEEFVLLQQFLAEHLERIREDGDRGGERSPGPSQKKRLEDPLAAGAVKSARQVMQKVPDVRKDLVESIRKKIQNGTFFVDRKTIADRILQEAVLNEM
jgi:flagellar biosynthesis anti-sigma factor FlgM